MQIAKLNLGSERSDAQNWSKTCPPSSRVVRTNWRVGGSRVPMSLVVTNRYQDMLFAPTLPLGSRNNDKAHL